MHAPTPQSGYTRWIALVALLALAAGLLVAAWQARPVRAPVATPRAQAPGEAIYPGEQVIERALRDVPSVQGPRTSIDSTAIKQRWVDEARGIDVTGLDQRRLELFLRFANAEQCTCGCGYTLAGCRASDMTCEVSGQRLEALLDSVRAGRITSARGIRARPPGGG
jgi:hypothetical protein